MAVDENEMLLGQRATAGAARPSSREVLPPLELSREWTAGLGEERPDSGGEGDPRRGEVR